MDWHTISKLLQRTMDGNSAVSCGGTDGASIVPRDMEGTPPIEGQRARRCVPLGTKGCRGYCVLLERKGTCTFTEGGETARLSGRRERDNLRTEGQRGFYLGTEVRHLSLFDGDRGTMCLSSQRIQWVPTLGMQGRSALLGDGAVSMGHVIVCKLP